MPSLPILPKSLCLIIAVAPFQPHFSVSKHAQVPQSSCATPACPIKNHRHGAMSQMLWFLAWVTELSPYLTHKHHEYLFLEVQPEPHRAAFSSPLPAVPFGTCTGLPEMAQHL